MNAQKKYLYGYVKALQCLTCIGNVSLLKHTILLPAHFGSSYQRAMRMHCVQSFLFFIFLLLVSITFSSVGHASNRINVDTDALFDICMQRCTEGSTLARLTINGCEKTCYEMRREFDLLDSSFRNYERCSDTVHDFTLNKDTTIEEKQKWCTRFNHIHERKGCLDAVEVFYSAVNEEQICGRGSAYIEPVALHNPASQPVGSGSATTAPVYSGQRKEAVSSYGVLTDTPKYQRSEGGKKNVLNTKPTPVQKPTAVSKPTPVSKTVSTEKDTPYDFSANNENSATPAVASEKAEGGLSSSVAASAPVASSGLQNPTPYISVPAVPVVPATPQGTTVPTPAAVVGPATPTVSTPSAVVPATAPSTPVASPSIPTTPTAPISPSLASPSAESNTSSFSSPSLATENGVNTSALAQEAESKTPVLTLTPLPPKEEQ